MTYASEVLADSPLIWYRLGDASGTTATDSSGNGRNGTYAGSPTLGASSLLVGDPSNSAVTFDGVNDKVTYADTTDLTALTIEAWIKRAPGISHYEVIAARDDGGGSDGIFGLALRPDGKAEGWVINAGGSYGAGNSAVSLADNAVHHVAFTFTTATGAWVLYVDGSSVASGTRSGTLRTADRPFVVGHDGTASNIWFNGTIDEVAYYATALSGTRIAAHYTAGSTGGTTTINPAFIASGAQVFAPVIVNGGVVVTPTPIASTAQVFAPTIAASIAVSPSLLTNTSTFYPPSITLESQVGEPDPAGAVDGWAWGGVGVGSWEPPVDPPTAAILPMMQVVAQAYTAPVIDGTHVELAPTYARETAHRERILIAGRDVSFFRGVPTPPADYQLVQPFLYGAASFELPQIVLPFEQPGHGDLSWLRKNANVVIQDVDPDTNEVIAIRWRGIILAFDTSGPLRVECGGAVTGRASLQDRQMRLIQTRRDAGGLVASAFRNLRGVVHKPILGTTTGIRLIDWGGGGFLDYLNELVSKMTTVDGDKWTVMPDTTGAFVTTLLDTETIHGTVYFDDARVKFDGRSDLTEEPNRIFASGVTPDGMVVKNGAYPGLIQGSAAPYPMDDNSSFGPGTTDADTDTGDGITVMGIRLRVTGYLDARPFYDDYDADMANGIKQLQRDAGLTVTGNVNVATWRALWDLSVTGYDLRGIEILPFAEDPTVKPFRRSGSGAIIARNPAYDASVNPVDRTIAMGAGFTKAQIRQWSRRELAGGEVWRGTIELSLGAIIAGEHTPGDPITEILRDRAIKPGMNLWAPLFAGGIVLHVAGVSVTATSVSLVVSTVPDDTIPVWAAIQRDRDNRNTVHRSFFAQRRSSSFERENTYDEVGGTISPVSLTGGQWTVFPVVAKQAGTIEKIHLDVTPDREFVVAAFGRKITRGRLRRVTNAPLTKAGRKRWTEESVYDRLNGDHVVLYVAGSDEDPLGYFPGRKSENDGLTGRWEDDASFPFVTFVNDTDRGSVIWLAVWVANDATLRGGRIMWPSAEEY